MNERWVDRLIVLTLALITAIPCCYVLVYMVENGENITKGIQTFVR